MKRIVLSVLFTMVVLVPAVCYWHHRQASALERLSEEKRGVELALSLLSGNMKMHYVYADRKLEDISLQDESREEKKISEFLNGEEKLVFKFSTSNCSTCVQSGFSTLRKLMRNLSSDQLLVIADRSNRREVRALANSLDLDFPIYMAEKGAFGDMLLNENVPFVFVLGSDLRMKDLFIPMKELPDYTDMYYRIVWKKYFSKE